MSETDPGLDAVLRMAREDDVAKRFAGELVELCRDRGMPENKRAQALTLVEPMMLSFVRNFLHEFEDTARNGPGEMDR